MQASKMTLLALVAAACFAAAHAPARAGAADRQLGVVDGVGYVPHSEPATQIASAVGAAAAGAAQTVARPTSSVATALGVVGGPLVANEVDRRSRRPDEDYRLGIRVDDGSYRTLILSEDPGLRIGDAVVVANDRIFWQ
jgi:outer membrane lipoprotein SlyB